MLERGREDEHKKGKRRDIKSRNRGWREEYEFVCGSEDEEYDRMQRLSRWEGKERRKEREDEGNAEGAGKV